MVIRQSKKEEQDTPFSHKVIKSFLWVGTGNFLGQFISWASTILVIRLLLPSDYGLMAMAITFISLMTMLSELGINASLIQAENINRDELKQIWGFIIISSSIFWLIAFLSAPLVAEFYNEQKLIPLIRVISINFFIIALYIIPQSLLIRDMNFKDKTKIDVLSQITASLVSVTLALNGMGVWTLVAALITLHLIKSIGYNIIQPCMLTPAFSYKGVERHIKFGLTVTGDRLLYYLYSQSDKIILGRFLGNHILGIYSVAMNLASIPMEKVLPIITQVSFTSYSRIQNDLDRINRNLSRSVRTISTLAFPLFFGMAGVAPEAVRLILGSKWETIILPFQIICLILPLKAMSPILPPAVFAISKPKVNLINMAISFVVMSLAFLAGIRSGIIGVCLAWLLVYPVVFIITSFRCLKVLKFPAKSFFREMNIPFSGSAIMLLCIYLSRKINITSNSIFFLIAAILFGIIFYSCFIYIFKKEDYYDLKRLVMKKTSCSNV